MINELIEAVGEEDLEKVKSLVDSGANIHAIINLSLRWASECGHLDMVKYLVEHGADVDAEDDNALRWAEAYSHLEVVKYLKNVYVKRYKEKFLCYKCLVLPCCAELCSDKLIKGDKYE